MFRDVHTGSMFTINAKLDEEELKAEEEFFAKKREGKPTTKQEEILEFERQHKKRMQSNYSSMTGVTGQVFSDGKLRWANDMKNLPMFQESIDNLSQKSGLVRNMIVAPLFGHRDDFEREDDA